MIGKIPRSNLRFEVSVVEHCNLNCKMCDHFSPIADEEYIDLKHYEKDMAQLARLFLNQAEYIYLLGGEPLLHPHIAQLCVIARKYFYKCPVSIFTNGLLLAEQPVFFWETLRNNNISLIITKYPVSFDYDALQAVIEKHGIKYSYAEKAEKKVLRYNPIDTNGGQNIYDSFVHCSHANNCITLSNGRLFPCSIVPCIKHLNKYYGLNLPISENDSIDIYGEISARDILLFLSQPIPFCQFCAVHLRKSGIPWSVSKKEQSEWVLTNVEVLE